VFRIKGNASFCLVVVAAMLSVLCSGCGSGMGSSMNNSMSPAQAQAVTDQVVQALTQALGNTFSSNSIAVNEARQSLSTVVRDIGSDASGGCTPTATGESCDWPISLMNDPCTGPQGGTISVSGDIDGTLNNSGSGSVSADITITPANCSVSNLIVNGDPSISVGGQVSFTDNETPVFPITFTETGGISYGPNPSGSCQLHVTYTINSSLSCTVSGTVCGQSVNGSC
jgi:hypothetical protein